MSSLSSNDNDIFPFCNQRDAMDPVNGFLAGFAGSDLTDGLEYGDPSSSRQKRALRLSAKSNSIEEMTSPTSDCPISHSSIAEEVVPELPNDSMPEDDESMHSGGLASMRISDGSYYPSQFSLISLSEVTGGVGKVQPHLRDSLSSVTDGSTIDASHVTLQELSLKEDEVEGDEDVFTPLSSSSFGGFDQQLDQATSLSSSSSSDFGDFDQQSAAGAPGADSFGVTCQVTSQDFPGVADVCYGEEGRNSRVHHSSPKKLLDDNFVWTQARSNVTKPSYSWETLKLHSYLLGALSVRKPISLNRLRPTVSPERCPTTHAVSTRNSETSVTSRDSPLSRDSSENEMVPPGDQEMGQSAVDMNSDGYEDSERDSLPSLSTSYGSPTHSYPMSPGTSSLSNPQSPGCSSRGSPFSWPGPSLSPRLPKNTRPSITSVVQNRLATHRRTHSSPIPNSLKLPVSDKRRISRSPGPWVGTMTKSNSVEAPVLSPGPAFDQGHAGARLSCLGLDDIQTIRHEMKTRVGELSATLIKEFQYRGEADHSKEVRKAFVSAFLTAEEKKSKGHLNSRQRSLIPIVCNEMCPSTEILVLLTQLLSGLINDTPHTAELLKHYMYMLCKPGPS